MQPDSRPLFYQFIAELKESCAKAEPTVTHHFLKSLAKEGKLARWYTQNIDCLEERLGLDCWSTAVSCDTTSSTSSLSNSSQSTVVSLHGTLSQVSCTLCKVTYNFTDEHLEVFKSGKELACHSCTEASELRISLGRRKLRSGFLRPDIVLYNEPHPHGDTIADFVSSDMAKQPNLLLVMGTSLKIAGLKKMIKDFAKNMKSRTGGENNLIVYINKTPCSRAEWQGVFDYELIGECDRWIEFFQARFQGLKSSPKIPISQLIPSSPLRSRISAQVVNTLPVSSSPVQPKFKKNKKKPVVVLSEEQPCIKSKSKSEEVVVVVPPSPCRIDQFFTPVKKSSTGRSVVKKDASSSDPLMISPPPNEPQRNGRSRGVVVKSSAAK